MRVWSKPLSRSKTLLIISFLAAFCCTLFMYASLTPKAHGATANDNTQITVAPGNLAFNTPPDVPNFFPVTINGFAQVQNAKLPNWSVADATGSGSGWNVTVQGDNSPGKRGVFSEYVSAAQYVPNGKSLPSNSLTLNKTGASFQPMFGTTGSAPALVPIICLGTCASIALDSPTPNIISTTFQSSPGTYGGMGTWEASNYASDSLALNIPADIQALPNGNVYRVNLIWSLSTGP